jgi:plasmid stability protein
MLKSANTTPPRSYITPPPYSPASTYVVRSYEQGPQFVKEADKPKPQPKSRPALMIGAAIATTIGREIDAAELDADARVRLRRCLPVVRDAVTAWQDDGGFAAPGLMIMVTTPLAAVVIHCDCWVEDVDDVHRAVALHALHKSVEAQEPPMLIAALTAALGPAGRAAAERDAVEITQLGKQPLLAVLVSPQQGDDAAVVLAITLPPAAAPSRIVH